MAQNYTVTTKYGRITVSRNAIAKAAVDSLEDMGSRVILCSRRGKILKKNGAAEFAAVEVESIQGDIRLTINVIVNDISVRGISLLIGKDQNINMGDVINLSFFKAGSMKRIQTKCKVVRLFKVGIYNAAGCVISDVDSDLTLFVAEKRQEYNDKLNVKVAV